MSMDFTGERFVPSETGKIRYEHLHRYALSLEFVAGKSVVDIASGEGYGAGILASTASSVTGVDHDIDSIKHAKRRYDAPGLSFVVGDCDSVPLPDNGFDVVTSFETIEHHDKHEEMLAEIQRLLKPDGILVISSPNRLTYSDEVGYQNPFHVKELYYDEFDELLRRHFRYVRIYGQKLAAGSFVFPLTDSDARSLGALTGDADRIRGQVCSLRSPAYFVAVCSNNRPIEDREISSIYVERAGDLLEILESERADQIQGMRAQVRKIEDEIADQRTGYEAQLGRQVEEMHEARTGYEAQITKQEDELIAARSNNEQLAESIHEAGEQLSVLNGLLSDAQEQVIQQANTISDQSTVISDQANAIARQTYLLNWIYSSRAWRIASKIREFGELTGRWRRFEDRIRGLLSGSRQETFHGNVDFAKSTGLREDSLEIRGWAYSRAGRVTFVEAFLDDIYLGHVRYGISRTDVVASFPDAPPECGYEERIPINGLRIEGRNHIKIRVYDERGNRQIYTVTMPLEPLSASSPITGSRPESTSIETPVEEPRIEAGAARSEATRIPTGAADAIVEFQERMERDPSVLDWNSGLNLSAAFPHLAVCTPPPTAGSDTVLPYLDHSVDIVVTSSADAEAHREAHRVAAVVIIRTGVGGSSESGQSDVSIDVDWHEKHAEKLSLPSASIVIPVFNNVSVTQSCLEQLSKTLPRTFSGEIIVVDDASSDETPSVLEAWARRDPRIMVLRNSENSGFIKSCNRGAEAASGEALVFLNNDTLPREGWLPPLLRVLRDKPDAGAVSGKLIYPDGRLQEAGGIVFSDGSACNFGKNDKAANAPLYNYLREVDYGSGALLATRRSLFIECGGFDVRFEPAYYEDADYCFTLRTRGYRVYYQPESVVVHFEGASSGTDLGTGVKNAQVKNRTRFVEKWGEALRHQPHAPAHYDLATLNTLATRGTVRNGNGQ